jgi:protein TonB
MPIAIPKAIQTSHSASEPPDLSASVTGGVVGGVPGGVLGGILGGTGTATPLPPPPPAAVASNKPLQVGGQVKQPRLVYDPAPEYPWLARDAEIQGDVQIDAVVDKNGNVTQMHVLNGPPLLIAAALQAVGKWKYVPTYLNGVAYPVELTVDVSFHLS